MDAPYDAVVFDNDGVLTTPTERGVLREAIHEAFDAVGATDPTDHHVETLLGPTVDSLRDVAADHGVDPRELWSARERAAVAAQRAELEAGRKRRYEDVAALEGLEVPTAIVSNNQHETIGAIIERVDLPAFDAWYGREPTLAGIERKKPTPYYLRRALEDVGAENPLFVGDSVADVRAADALGIDAAFLRRDHREGYDLPLEPSREISSLSSVPPLLE